MGVEWRGGDVARWPGGGQKVNLLRPVLEAWRESNDVVVMFVDSYDVIFTAGEAEILAKFRDFNSRVVFSAEPFCWPDSNLAVSIPLHPLVLCPAFMSPFGGMVLITCLIGIYKYDWQLSLLSQCDRA